MKCTTSNRGTSLLQAISHCPRAPSPLRKCSNMSLQPRPRQHPDAASRSSSPATSDRSSCAPDPSSSSASAADDEPPFSLTVHLHGQAIDLPFATASATLDDLSSLVSEDLNIPPENQKFLITPKTGLLKPPFAQPALPLSSIRDKKIVLLGATQTEIADLQSTLAARRAKAAARTAALNAGRKIKPAAAGGRSSKRIQEEARYTFQRMSVLEHLPEPARSRRFLTRLRDDAGIKAAMRRHGFAVGLLTEMDPAAHTTHDSRTLGLNRNRGEAIELRLRTDAYDGYRDYKVIRKTLCHELAHNVWGEHDANFWRLCRQIEAEVERNDWRSGGRSVGHDEFYNPADQGVDEEADGGGWIGGSFRLGGAAKATMASGHPEPLTRREIMARAAEERMLSQTETRPMSPSSSSPPPPSSSPSEKKEDETSKST